MDIMLQTIELSSPCIIWIIIITSNGVVVSVGGISVTKYLGSVCTVGMG